VRPPGVYRAVAEPPTRGAWVAACVSAEAVALARARGYLGRGSCAGGVQPVLKPVIAVAGDVVELGPDSVAVNGQRLPDSASADVDSVGRALPYPISRRYLVAPGELWLVSTRVPNSWDSRYLGQVQCHRSAWWRGPSGRSSDAPSVRRCLFRGAPMTALASDHLDLSARLSSRHRRRHTPLPRGAGRRRWGGVAIRESPPRGRAFLSGVDPRWQRSTVKASYSRNGRNASWAAHGTYLAREGAQREGGKGRGFAAEQEGIDLTATVRGWQRAGDVRLWKFIVSPEHAERLDLNAHTRGLVSQMERDLGTRLEWVAIAHYNTDNPHVRLLVPGRDAQAEALQLHPARYARSAPAERAVRRPRAGVSGVEREPPGG
jgi:conjugative transfer signal peptidase TraF